jgi:hypothetical protein
MRTVYVVASCVALALAACDRDANNNQGPLPSSYGGGPPSEPAESSAPAPASSVVVPGDAGIETDDNGKRRPMDPNKRDMIPNTTDPTTKY